jgi:hypothetical protein
LCQSALGLALMLGMVPVRAQVVSSGADTQFVLATSVGRDFLEKFSATNWNDFCLAHLFTHQGMQIESDGPSALCVERGWLCVYMAS